MASSEFIAALYTYFKNNRTEIFGDTYIDRFTAKSCAKILIEKNNIAQSGFIIYDQGNNAHYDSVDRTNQFSCGIRLKSFPIYSDDLELSWRCKKAMNPI